MADERRDESNDVALWKGLSGKDFWEADGGPFTVHSWSDALADNWNRYVPFADLEAAQKRVAELEHICNYGGGGFARLETSSDDDGAYSWFVCHKCGERVENTDDLGDSADGNGYTCSCGQGFVAVTHLMLHETRPITQEQLDKLESILAKEPHG